DDALRRLAGEEERLADGARRLQAGVQQQTGAAANRGKTADQRARAGIGDRAREFARLSERMQQAADQLRAAGGGPGGKRGAGTPKPQATAQEEIARALERLADTLGGSEGKDDESR